MLNIETFWKTRHNFPSFSAYRNSDFMFRFIFYLVVDKSIFKCVLLYDSDLILNRIRDSELKYIQKCFYLKSQLLQRIICQILISEKNHSNSKQPQLLLYFWHITFVCLNINTGWLLPYLYYATSSHFPFCSSLLFFFPYLLI